MATTEILILVTCIFALTYLWLKQYYSYWKRHNIVSIEPNIPFGNLKDLVYMKTSPAIHFNNLYHDKKAHNQPLVGIHVFHQPALLLRHPDVIKQVLIKDFSKFSNRFTMADPHNDSLGSYNLFFVKNPVWRQLRQKLTPVFTSGKMKQMFGLVDAVGKKLNTHLCSLPLNPNTNSAVDELKEICSLYTTDVVASIAFGLEANSFKNPNGDFRRNGRAIFNFTTWRAIEFTTVFFIPKLVSLLHVKMFSKQSACFLRTTIEYVMSEREKSGVTRNDLIDVLIGIRRSDKTGDDSLFKFTNDVLVAQAAVFFTAGFETSSAAMSFALYELSKRQDLQQRLREEIRTALTANKDELTYDNIHSMEYLNMVFQETFRMYPALPFLDRELTLADNEKSYSIGDVHIENGTAVYIPIYALHRDPKYFPNPDTFDPERFAPANKDNTIPFTFLPFGAGPHNCIGERFGIMQAKVGLVYFLRNHYVRPCDKSMEVMKLDEKALITQAKGGIYCDIVRDPLVIK